MPITMLLPIAMMLATESASPPDDAGWNITEATTPLTGATSVTAILPSAQPVFNMIGQPDTALLILRCQDNVLATYISWPQVLTQDGATFGGRAQTMILWRLDDAPIAVNYWLRSDDGTAIGMFDTKASVKLLGPVIMAKRLTVRLRGTTTQDAVFDLGDIATVAKRVTAPCGVTWTIPAK